MHNIIEKRKRYIDKIFILNAVISVIGNQYEPPNAARVKKLF